MGQYIRIKMHWRSVGSFFLLMGLSVSLHAQKIKYKDLFVLLNAKQYEQAEPFLKKYLAENDDNPNAFLFMGTIYQEKANKADFLMHTTIMLNWMDSAVLYYDKAYKAMTEKEINHNEEYYQAYSRRDLRTGKFGIKLTDVQYDLEKRIQGLNEKKGKVKTLKAQYLLAEAIYARTNTAFKVLQGSYPSMRELYLRADDNLNSELKNIAIKYDSFQITFNDYKATSKLLGKTGYNQVLDPQDIRDFKNDGSSLVDFTQDNLKVWDYKRWALSNLELIEKEVNPLKEHLITYDKEINNLRDKLKKDSVSVRSDLTQLIDKILYANLKKYDPQPMPMAVFGMKIAELEYGSDLIANKPLKDSADVNLGITCVKNELKDIQKLDSIAGYLLSRNIDADAEDYKHFVTSSYGTPLVLKSLIRTTKEYAEREKLKKEKEWEIRMQALKWIVDGSDSIPLFADASQQYKYKPLITDKEEYTAGLKYADSVATGYFYTVVPSRKPEVKAEFPVNQAAFQKRNLPITKALSSTDGKGQVYFILLYSENKVANKFPVSIAKIYRTDGLSWTNAYTFESAPSELVFAADSGELSVKVTNPNGESKMIVIDKNGKQVQ